MERDLIFGLFALIGLIVFIAQAVINQRNVGALTIALKDAQNDPRLLSELHNLATGVVPVETLHKLMDLIGSGAALAKTFTPDDVDAAIDAGAGLVKAVVDGTGDRPHEATLRAVADAIGKA